MSSAARWAISFAGQPDRARCSLMGRSTPAATSSDSWAGSRTSTTRSTKMPGVTTPRDRARPAATTVPACTIVVVAGRRHQRAEVARGLVVDQVAVAVGGPALDQGEVGGQPVLQHVVAAVEGALLLALLERRADRGARVEGGDAGAAGADALGQRALRHELELGAPAAVELGEDRRVGRARVRADHLRDAPGLDQRRQADLAAAGVVVDDGQVGGALVDQRVDQLDRAAGLAEAADHHRRAVEDVGDRLGRARRPSCRSCASPPVSVTLRRLGRRAFSSLHAGVVEQAGLVEEHAVLVVVEPDGVGVATDDADLAAVAARRRRCAGS